MDLDAKVTVPVVRCDDSIIRMSMHLGTLRTHDGTVIGTVAGGGERLEIRLEGMGRWEVNVLEIATVIMEAVGQPDEGPLSPQGESARLTIIGSCDG